MGTEVRGKLHRDNALGFGGAQGLLNVKPRVRGRHTIEHSSIILIEIGTRQNVEYHRCRHA